MGNQVAEKKSRQNQQSGHWLTARHDKCVHLGLNLIDAPVRGKPALG